MRFRGPEAQRDRYHYEEWVKTYVESKPLSNPSVTLGEQSPQNSAAVVRTDEGTAAGPGENSAGGPA